MFDDDSNLKDGGQKKPPGNGFNRIPAFTLLAWAGIVAAVVVLFLMKQHITAPPQQLTQAEFLEKFSSNQIATATLVVNQQALPLVEIDGSYLALDKDGKAGKDQIPFVVRNAWMTPE